uniref:Transmembrane protein n=1 Tax=Neospora caninum (strain Liverpool) TaxID=572307 RepID=A0A0F7UR61_NEOCL|nr:TPA: hypothetical protein BN1204_062510 [Neospora caninum Liverpool]
MTHTKMYLSEAAPSRRALRSARVLAPLLACSLALGVFKQPDSVVAASSSSLPSPVVYTPEDEVPLEGTANAAYPAFGSIGDSASLLFRNDAENAEARPGYLNAHLEDGEETEPAMHQMPLGHAIEETNVVNAPRGDRSPGNAAPEELLYATADRHNRRSRGPHRMGRREEGRRRASIRRRHSSHERFATIASVAIQSVIAAGLLAAGAAFVLRQRAEIRKAAVATEKAALLKLKSDQAEEAVSLQMHDTTTGKTSQTPAGFCSFPD